MRKNARPDASHATLTTKSTSSSDRVRSFCPKKEESSTRELSDGAESSMLFNRARCRAMEKVRMEFVYFPRKKCAGGLQQQRRRHMFQFPAFCPRNTVDWPISPSLSLFLSFSLDWRVREQHAAQGLRVQNHELNGTQQKRRANKITEIRYISCSDP
jgi:hypothetical protein